MRRPSKIQTERWHGFTQQWDGFTQRSFHPTEALSNNATAKVAKLSKESDTLFPHDDIGRQSLRACEIIPDLSAIANHQLIPDHKALIGIGAFNRVYKIHGPNDKPMVLKVERQYLPAEYDLPISPWAHFNLLLEREDVTTDPETWVARRSDNIQIQNLLHEVGIRTTEYIGSLIIEGHLRSEDPQSTTIPGQNTLPMYAELWTNPGGLSTSGDSKARGEIYRRVDSIYSSASGRGEMRRVGAGLLALVDRGISIDCLLHQDGFVLPATTKEDNPYPTNFIITDNNELVAYDFNVSFDIGNFAPWLHAEINRRGGLYIYNPTTNRYDIDSNLISDYFDFLSSHFRNQNDIILSQLKISGSNEELANTLALNTVTQRQLYEELTRLVSQTRLACEILNRIAVLEKTSSNQAD